MTQSQPVVKPAFHYNRASLKAALLKVGLRNGDVVLSHVGIGWLGNPEEGTDLSAASAVLHSAIRDVIGENGTWLVPTYTYSFCRQEIFDPKSTSSRVGGFSDYFWRLPGVVRSEDPIFSVAAEGPLAEPLLKNLPPDCFGLDCVYDRLIRNKAKMCNIGVPFMVATMLHHVEEMIGVPYRFRKEFPGQIVRQGQLVPETWTYYVRHLYPNTMPNFDRIEAQSRAAGITVSEPAGRNFIHCSDMADLAALTTKNIKEDPWCMATGPKMDF